MSKKKPQDPQPLLGLASTDQLLRELIARWSMDLTYDSVDRAVVLAEMLGRLDAATREYRTVDS
jgi:hypothetical protein